MTRSFKTKRAQQRHQEDLAAAEEMLENKRKMETQSTENKNK